MNSPVWNEARKPHIHRNEDGIINTHGVTSTARDLQLFQEQSCVIFRQTLLNKDFTPLLKVCFEDNVLEE